MCTGPQYIVKHALIRFKRGAVAEWRGCRGIEKVTLPYIVLHLHDTLVVNHVEVILADLVTGQVGATDNLTKAESTEHLDTTH